MNLGLVSAVAKKVVADALEDKYAAIQIGGGGMPIYFNAAITSNQEVYPLLPQIIQGTNSNNRVGDKIRPKKLRVDFVITANGQIPSSQLNQVRLFVLQDKSIRNSNALRDVVGAQIGTPIATALIDKAGVTTGFDGTPSSVMFRVNKERYMVYKDKVYEVLSGLGLTPQPPTNYGTQTFVSGQQCYKFSVVIPTPATLNYSGSLDFWPTNFAPFMCLGYCQPDGNAAPDTLTLRVACNWVSHLDFEDA